jgi:hypothetical protein
MKAPDNTPTELQIAQRAYEIYLLEGKPEGQAMEHWLQAETELKEALRKMPVHDLNATAHVEAEAQILVAGSKRNRGKSKVAALPEGPAVPKDGPLHGDKKSGRTGERAGAVGNREGIQEVTHRVMGSRQSERSIERSGQRRQPKRGHGSQKAREQSPNE